MISTSLLNSIRLMTAMHTQIYKEKMGPGSRRSHPLYSPKMPPWRWNYSLFIPCLHKASSQKVNHQVAAKKAPA